MLQGIPSSRASFGGRVPTTTLPRASRLLAGRSLLGVEIELENASSIIEAEAVSCELASSQRGVVPKDWCAHWLLKTDGSLRRTGVELVLRRPMGGIKLEQALVSLDELFAYAGEVEVTERCSVHIHMDTRPLEYKTIINIVLLYLMFEEIIFSWCGTHREKNPYCLPWLYNNELLSALSRFHGYIEVLDATTPPSMVFEEFKSDMQSIFGGELTKYTSLNLLPLLSLGSIEFRMFPGTNSVTDITNYVNLVYKLYNFVVYSERSRGYEFSLKNELALLSGMGPEEYTKLVFGNLWEVLGPHLSATKLYSGARRAQEVLFSNKAKLRTVHHSLNLDI